MNQGKEHEKSNGLLVIMFLYHLSPLYNMYRALKDQDS
jgi:hypothetical protein